MNGAAKTRNGTPGVASALASASGSRDRNAPDSSAWYSRERETAIWIINAAIGASTHATSATKPPELLSSPPNQNAIRARNVIAAPIVTGLTLAAVQQIPARFRLQLLALGASRPQMVWALLREARLPMLAALMAGFGGVISEVGASMMVGGNIRGSTRVLTTATVLETGKGNFDIAIALSVILLLITFLVNWALSFIQQRRRA